MSELVFLTAKEQAAGIRARRFSSTELVQAHLDQIERINPRVNALVTTTAEQALDAAAAVDARPRGAEKPPLLHGVPFVIKDLVPTKGVRTTYGSPIYAAHVPDYDALNVQRLKAAGGILLGKTNTPEFGAGSQTFNAVFGATLNPYDLEKTCGGSSGGSAVALACGMAPLADGSDLGGSLRNPAGYCNVVGFRPSAGRVPTWPRDLAWDSFSVQGPMARTVGDVALMLAVMAGPDPRAPLSLPDPGIGFLENLERGFQGVKVAWSPDLGSYPVDAGVLRALESQLAVFASLGCTMETVQPDLSGADEIFQINRAWLYAAQHSAHLEKHRSLMKDTVIWNTEQGQGLTGADLAHADTLRARLYERVAEFFGDYEYLILPTAQVPPFAVTIPYPTQINGKQLKTYIDWMGVCYAITVTGLPAISVPCAFTAEGLPVGLQIVGRRQADFQVLQLAFAFEQATQTGQNRPSLVH